MRRTFITLGLALVAALAVAGGAFAKDGGVELSSTPYGTPPGGTWTPTLTVIDVNGWLPVSAKPTVELTNLGTGSKQVFAAKPTGTRGRYTVDVVFPSPGRYAYKVTNGFTDREYTFPPVRIVGTGSAVPVPSSGGDGSFPVWPSVAGGIALLIAAGRAAVYARRRRLGLSH